MSREERKIAQQIAMIEVLAKMTQYIYIYIIIHILYYIHTQHTLCSNASRGPALTLASRCRAART